jgi:activator of HSP90 ATPase
MCHVPCLVPLFMSLIIQCAGSAHSTTSASQKNEPPAASLSLSAPDFRQMSATNEPHLIKCITDMISDAFELDHTQDDVEATVATLSSNILKLIKKTIPIPKATAATAAVAAKPSSSSKSGEKKKGNAYSNFVKIAAAQAKQSGQYADVTITPIHRDKVSEKTAANIADHIDEISFDVEMTFAELFDMINKFEGQTMKRAGIMWNLLSDSDRKQFKEDE